MVVDCRAKMPPPRRICFVQTNRSPSACRREGAIAIKVGVQSQSIPPFELAVAQAVSNEQAGFDSIWYPDHLMGWFPRSLWTADRSSVVNLLPSPHIFLDPTILIGLVGQATERALIGTAVTEPLRRPPAELARAFLTLSHATGGRAVLGIGAGERENVEPYGLDYRHQVSKLDEALHIIRLLWESKDPISFDGRFWKLRKAVIDLPPFADTYPPIWVGAHGPRMLELTGRHADGWLPSYPMDPADYAERLQAVRKAAAEAGRDPEAIEAGFQIYVIVADDHATAHEILASPLAGAMSLVASSEMWERTGRKHPLGEGFEGLRDYVPEWLSESEVAKAVSAYDPDIFHDLVPHGTVEEVAAGIERFVDAGLEHAVLVNLAPLAGLEYVQAAQEGSTRLLKILKG